MGPHTPSLQSRRTGTPSRPSTCSRGAVHVSVCEPVLGSSLAKRQRQDTTDPTGRRAAATPRKPPITAQAGVEEQQRRGGGGRLSLGLRKSQGSSMGTWGGFCSPPIEAEQPARHRAQVCGPSALQRQCPVSPCVCCTAQAHREVTPGLRRGTTFPAPVPVHTARSSPTARRTTPLSKDES